MRNKRRIQSLVVCSDIVGALTKITVASNEISNVALHIRIRRILVRGLLLLLQLRKHVVVVWVYQRVLPNQEVSPGSLVLVVHIVAHEWMLSVKL